jgi:hypothetical protein
MDPSISVTVAETSIPLDPIRNNHMQEPQKQTSPSPSGHIRNPALRVADGIVPAAPQSPKSYGFYFDKGVGRSIRPVGRCRVN